MTVQVSSTKIRRALSRNQSVRYLVHDTVLDYIVQQGLYAPPRLDAAAQPSDSCQ